MNLESVITLIPRADIPAIFEVEKEGKTVSLGELRDFKWHDYLKKFLPNDDSVSFSWVKLLPGEILRTHVHSTASMIICYKGEGEFIGDKNGLISEGDVVAVPANCQHGFIGRGLEGLWALSIQFGAGLYTDPTNARVTFIEDNASFESMLAFNQSCIENFKQSRFLKMLTDGTLSNPAKRQRYVDALQIWSDYNQDLLFARQGTSGDSYFSPIFLQHMFEEVGHDRVHAERQENFESKSLIEDPVIEAVAHWFICQMFRADNIVKTALIHLIIENGSDIYHKIARPVLNATVNDHYFELHEADTEHAKIALKLLNQLSPVQYKELHKILDKGWKMLACMTNRVCELVDAVN